MQIRHVVGLALAGSIALAASVIGIAQSAPAPAAPGAAKAPAPAAGTATSAADTQGPLQILDFKPGLDDLMNMLVQPRHQKLWAAGQQRNWPLAAFQLREMRNAFDRIAATIPKYTNIDLGPTFINIMDSQVRAVNGAITSQNAALFNSAFADLTAACNSCHEALNLGILVMKVPEVTGYPNQDFRALPGAAAPAAAKK
jgi:hypothetical protein